MRTDVRLPELLTVDEVALALRVSPATVYRWASVGTVPVSKVGGVLRIRVDEVERLIGLEDGRAPSHHGAAPTTTASRAIPRGRRHPRGSS